MCLSISYQFISLCFIYILAVTFSFGFILFHFIYCLYIPSLVLGLVLPDHLFYLFVIYHLTGIGAGSIYSLTIYWVILVKSYYTIIVSSFVLLLAIFLLLEVTCFITCSCMIISLC